MTMEQLAIDAARLVKGENAYEKIINGIYAPLQFLYVELAKKKEIQRLSELSEEKRLYYWGKVRGLDCHKYKKIWISQALYMFDLLNQVK